MRDFSDKRRRGDHGRSHDDLPVFRRKRSRSLSPRTKKSHRDDLGHRLESRTERTRKLSRPDSRSPRRRRTKSPTSGDEGSKSKHRRQSLSRSDEVEHHSSDKRDNQREDKSKSRSRRHRSRSDSPLGRNHAQRSSPRVLEESRSRRRKRSRSRSVEDKHQSGEKHERDIEDKSRDEDKRRSRSRSAEGKHGRRSDGHKSKHRKHCRLNSSEKNSNLNDIVTVESKDKTLKVENEKSVASDDMDVGRLTESRHIKDNEFESDKSFSE